MKTRMTVTHGPRPPNLCPRLFSILLPQGIAKALLVNSCTIIGARKSLLRKPGAEAVVMEDLVAACWVQHAAVSCERLIANGAGAFLVQFIVFGVGVLDLGSHHDGGVVGVVMSARAISNCCSESRGAVVVVDKEDDEYESVGKSKGEKMKEEEEVVHGLFQRWRGCTKIRVWWWVERIRVGKFISIIFVEG